MTKKKAAKKSTKKSATKVLNLPENKDRRKIRHRLFLIRMDKDTIDDDLRLHMESQFTSKMGWKNFTFEWDVSPKDPLKVITPEEWTREGGGMDLLTGKMYPPAFTGQR